MLGAWFHVCWILITTWRVKSYTPAGAEETCQEEAMETTCDNDRPNTRDTSNMTNRYLAVVKDDQGIKELQRFGFASTLTLLRASITISMSKVACLLHFSLLMISHVFERSKQVGPREHSPAAIGHFLSVSLFSVFMGDYATKVYIVDHYGYIQYRHVIPFTVVQWNVLCRKHCVRPRGMWWCRVFRPLGSLVWGILPWSLGALRQRQMPRCRCAYNLRNLHLWNSLNILKALEGFIVEHLWHSRDDIGWWINNAWFRLHPTVSPRCLCDMFQRTVKLCLCWLISSLCETWLMTS